MKLLLSSASFLFHPVWMPLAGTSLYFLISPRFFPDHVVEAKILAVAIMTVFIPVVFFFMLKTLGQVRSHELKEPRERKWPLVFSAALDFIVMKFVLDSFDYPELYYFFFGIFLSTLTGLSLLYLNLKASLHMIGLSGVIAFLVLLSLHFSLDLVYLISLMVLLLGLAASSRIYLKEARAEELLAGILIGIVPQIAVGLYWL